MSYASIGGCYSAGSSRKLEQTVNKFYVNGDININNGIQHTIAAQKTGDIRVYNQTIENHVQNNYVINLDNRKVEFIAPYIGGESGEKKYLSKDTPYLLPDLSDNYASNASQEYQGSITSGLLKSRRPATQFIEDAEEVEGIVKETFETLTGQTLPDDIVVRVLSEDEMKKAHAANGGKWSPGIMGFALNRAPYPSTIFIRKNNLDSLMLVIGHELGHVLSERLASDLDEEAKAFAFELAWAKCIVENDIGGLAANFDVDFMPAENGLHDKAFAFVQDVVKKGKDALKAFWEIATGNIRASKT